MKEYLDDIIERAKGLVESGKIIFEKNDDSSEIASIGVSVKLEYLINGKETISKARIQIKPDAISEIVVGGKVLYEKSPKSEMAEEEKVP